MMQGLGYLWVSQPWADEIKSIEIKIYCYTLDGVKNFYKTILIHVERGILRFKDPGLVTKVNKLNLRYLRKPQMSEKSVASDKTSAQRPKREVPCNKFQSGECTHKAGHVTPSGLKVVHKCRCCLKWRPTLPADHPASKCKYKSKAEREALDADGAHNDPQALSLEARSPPAGLRTILDAPSQHGLRIVSPVLDAPAHTGLRVVSGASAHAAARTSPTMSAPAGSVNACRLHDIVLSSGQYNHRGLRVPVPSYLAIPVWRSALANYSDKVVCDFLEFGWPVGYDKIRKVQAV
ncbi:Hypp9627 [Branchiostoma lanceolatum]|uniref:Hypp9627 protein n=1 Tax=Branchiostoma lanceolatum TaxID=7740 RepID=A0A8S4MNH7_BRALA|nr:Hypp9627 [Branchiostoma lanceolatum]